jgi:hypothetical protein
MWLAFALYVVLHSPLRGIAARLAGRPGQLAYFSSLGDIGFMTALNGALGFVTLAAAAGAAAFVASRFAGPVYERALVFSVNAFAFVVVPAAIIGELGALTESAPLRPPLGPALVSVPAIATLLWALARGWRPALHLTTLRSFASGPVMTMGGLAAVLIGSSAFVALTRPPTGFDALAYHGPMSVYLWRDGNLADFLTRAGGTFAMALPGAAELWFGLLLIAGGEPLANIGQMPFVFMGGLAVYGFARRSRVPRRAAAMSALSFLLVPMVAVQAGMQLNDIIATALLATAAVLLCSSPHSWTGARLATAGLALGLATTTKLSVLPALAAIALFAGAAMLADQSARRRSLRLAVAVALGFTLAVAPWWIRNATIYGNPTYPVALPLLSGSMSTGVEVEVGRIDHRFVPSAAAWPLYPLLEAHSEQSGFGPLWPIAAVPGVFAALWAARRRALWLFGALTVFTAGAWVFFTAHEPRHLLLITALGFAFAPFAFSLVARSMRSSVAVLWLAAAVFSVAVTLDQAILPRLREPLDRAAFYDDVWGIDPVVAGNRPAEPLVYNMGYATLSYAGDYPLLGPSRERRLFTVSPAATTSEIVALMQRFGVDYAYVPASAESVQTVRTKYDPTRFTLEHESVISNGDRRGTRRYLFRLRGESATGAAVTSE